MCIIKHEVKDIEEDIELIMDVFVDEEDYSDFRSNIEDLEYTIRFDERHKVIKKVADFVESQKDVWERGQHGIKEMAEAIREMAEK